PTFRRAARASRSSRKSCTCSSTSRDTLVSHRNPNPPPPPPPPPSPRPNPNPHPTPPPPPPHRAPPPRPPAFQRPPPPRTVLTPSHPPPPPPLPPPLCDGPNQTDATNPHSPDIPWTSSPYNLVFKILFISSQLYIIYLMASAYKPTNGPNLDTFRVEYLLGV